MKKVLGTLSIEELKAEARTTASQFNDSDKKDYFVDVLRALRPKMNTEDYLKFINSLT